MWEYFTKPLNGLVKLIEKIMALVVLVGVVISSIGSIQVLAQMDWRQTETFYELIYRVLLLVIGVELVRMLVVHDLLAVLELLAFVIARKMLKPDLKATDVILVVLAFAILMGTRWVMAMTRPDGLLKPGEPGAADKIR